MVKIVHMFANTCVLKLSTGRLKNGEHESSRPRFEEDQKCKRTPVEGELDGNRKEWLG
jgi:hypothetical protein